MNYSSEYDEHVQVLTGKHVGTLILCIFGGILNAIMLYMLLHKKQIRSSVHTVYMVQIAITDLLVCAVWLIMTSVIIHHTMLIPTTGPPEIGGQADGDANTTGANETISTTDNTESQFRSWRVMYSWYNFHYYVNIFLLASMSVERCAAVWKSMRCQRYQYNRKVIIIISIIMWILAWALVMPEMVNPDLMASESDSPEGVSRVLFSGNNSMHLGADAYRITIPVTTNFSEEGLHIGRSTSSTTRPFEKMKITYDTDMEVLTACNTLLEKADREKRMCVESDGKLTVHICFREMYNMLINYGPLDPSDLLPSDETDEEVLTGDIPDDFGMGGDNSNYQDLEDLLQIQGEGSIIDYDIPEIPGLCNETHPDIYDENEILISMDKLMYRFNQELTITGILDHYSKYDERMQSACYPDIAKATQIYIVIVNLILGFFVPFCIIVFSYVSIACMIGKRVRSRMNTSLSETSTTHLQPNPSTTDGNQAASIQLREKKTQRNSRNDSMSRRMSDFMRYILLRRPHDGLENRSYMTDSDQHSTAYNSSRRITTNPSQGQHIEEPGEHIKPDATPYQNPSEQQSSEDDPIHDPQFEEAIRQGNRVRLRNENSRIKYPVCHDSTNENIPQTIEEHPHETDGEEDELLLRASNGSSITDGLSQHSIRAAPSRMVQRNSGSRRESGGSYGSSMDSMATDQTSLLPCVDKRHSGAMMSSALTPPTPADVSNPYANQFFPAGDERTAHPRTQTGETNHVTGSGSNDIRQPYRKSTQRQANDSEDRNRVKDTVGVQTSIIDSGSSRKRTTSPHDGYSFPPASRGRNVQDERWLTSRSNSRYTNEVQSDQDSYKQNPTYSRLSSTTSSVFQSRRRPSSSSKRSTGGTRSSSKKRSIVHKYAEKQLRVSRTLLIYVIVFSICWLPQRITYLLYVIEALVGAVDITCVKLITGVRLLSFISVLLNPAVYILTQRQFQEYIRKSACVKFMRRWYAKCFKRNTRSPDMNMDSRFRITSERNDEVDQQIRGMQEDRTTSVLTRQNSNAKAPYRMPAQTRPIIHSRPGANQHDMLFAQPAMRHRDATIDEMKEEEAAAEESLEKEMKRLAAEEEKRRKDDINRNFMESSEDDILSNKTGSGSGNKTTSSSTKSDNFEELWKRWVQSGGTTLPSVSPDNADNNIAGMDSEFDNIKPIANGSVEHGVLE